MAVYKGTVTAETVAGKPTYVDITEGVAAIVAESGITEGVVNVISCHTTCAIFSQEYDHDHTPAGDTFMQADLSDGLNKISPSSTTGQPTAIRAFSTLKRWRPGLSWTSGFPVATARSFGTATRTCAR